MRTVIFPTRLLVGISAVISVIVFTGCDTAPSNYTYGGPYTPGQAAWSGRQSSADVVRVDPHYGTQYRDGMEAIGQVARPFASPNAPINTQPNKTMDALRGYGTLLDLFNEK